jgi:hypothetical protein
VQALLRLHFNVERIGDELMLHSFSIPRSIGAQTEAL